MKRPGKKINTQKILKQKMKQKQNYRKLHSSPIKPKKYPSIKPKGAVYFKHHKLSYRLPILIFFLSLLLLILIIPTLIVFPSGVKKEELAEEVKEQSEEAGESEVSEETEAISVAVMRAKTDVIENVPLEDYIVGVVAAEMPADFDIEALKAQALAARTFTVNHLLENDENADYDITDTVQHQVYKSDEELRKQWGSAYEENIEKISSAVKATAGEILTYQDDPIMPAFFSMSNGYTENSEDYWESKLPYLRSVESPWETDNPKFLSQETFSKAELEKLLSINLGGGAENNLVIARKDSGRVDKLTVGGHSFTGREVREKLGLRSSDFSVKQNNGHFIFTTKGYGHGVGMSQYGADAMAKEGKNYEEIVKHYYQEVEIDSLNETALTLVSK